MKLFLYKVLTQIIIILGQVRKLVENPLAVRNDRVFIDLDEHQVIQCCDCLSTHYVHPLEGRGERIVKPMRPRGYDYSLRRFAAKSSPFNTWDEAIAYADKMVLEEGRPRV